MTIFINCICDNNCFNGFQPANFDALSETWFDMIEAFRTAGWSIVLDGAKIQSCYCPDCLVSTKIIVDNRK